MTRSVQETPHAHGDTELGLLPKRWQSIALGDLGTIITGTTPSTRHPEYYNGSFMFIAPGDIGSSKYITNPCKRLSEEGLRASRPLPKDSVLVVCIGATIGKVGMTFVDDCTTNQQINAIIPKMGFDSHYLYYSLCYHADSLPSLASRAAIPIINKSNFAQFRIPTPTLSEQKKIAAVLSAVQEAKEKTENVIRAAKELKKSLMKYLFTYGAVPVEEAENVPLQGTEVGFLPDVWKLTDLGSLLRERVLVGIQDGNHGERHPRGADFKNTGIPFLTANCVRDGRVIWQNANFLSDEFLSMLRVGFSRPGDVLLTHKGTIGESAILGDEYATVILSPQVTYYRIGNKNMLDPGFLLSIFDWDGFKTQLRSLGSAQSTRAYVGITKQKGIIIPLPSIDVQRRIASIFLYLVATIQKEEDKRNSLEALFKTLLQNLMTGKVRVNDLEV